MNANRLPLRATSRRVIALLVAALLVTLGPKAHADDARTLFKQGTAAYQLGKFAEAAALYERAYELHPDAALLYNAAQANRLAGNRSRALFLYQSYLRENDHAGNRDEVVRFVDQLKASLQAQPEASPAPSPSASSAPSTVTEPSPIPVTEAPPAEHAGTSKWVWVAIGVGAVVLVGAAVGIGVGVAASQPARDPVPSYGVFTW